MLVLSRRLDESILIGDDIVITVVDIRDGKVRLGITAPVEVDVDRQEIRQLKDQAKRSREAEAPEQLEPPRR
ncbi:carbon storage regulator [Tautonia sp. JC769]|uniref:carbon storage regulator n=1 Tax=Tautonia sp. JC769 TaxID=3232135 RepID=UPI0034595514